MKRRGQQPPSISGQQLPSSSGLTAVEKPGTTISLPRTVHLSVQHCAHGGAPNLASRASAQQKSVKFWKRFLQGWAPLALGCARRRRYFWMKWTPWKPSAPPAAKRHGQQTSSSITRTWIIACCCAEAARGVAGACFAFVECLASICSIISSSSAGLFWSWSVARWPGRQRLVPCDDQRLLAMIKRLEATIPGLAGEASSSDDAAWKMVPGDDSEPAAERRGRAGEKP